ncbi:MAG: hypothetical protein ACRYF3_15995 [Janthinobacterium lividum]
MHHHRFTKTHDVLSDAARPGAPGSDVRGGAARRPSRAGLAVAAVLATLLAPVLTAAPASAATPRLTLRNAGVVLQAPAQTRPLDDDCWRGSSGELCGYGVVTADLTGFDAFGGIPSCDPEDASYSDFCDQPVASLVETEGTRVDLIVRCQGEWYPRYTSIPVTTERTHLVGPSEVTGFNRLSSDAARVSILFYLPTPGWIGLCGVKPTTLLTAYARNVTIGWSSEESAGDIPAGKARIGGVYRVRL